MGSGGKGSSNSTKTTIRYAPYIEDAHKALLNNYANYRAALIGSSVFSDFEEIPVDLGFFGSGYVMGSFPSLYDMFGKFEAGLDIDVLFDQVFADTVNSAAVGDLVESEASDIRDDIDSNVLPTFELGMQDANAVNTSSFIIGKALIEEARLKRVTEFSAKVRTSLIPTATERWKTHLEHNRAVVKDQADIMKLYFAVKMAVNDHNYGYAAKDTLWPFTVLEFERLAVGTLQGATTSKSSQDSGGGGILSTVLSVVGLGAMFL